MNKSQPGRGFALVGALIAIILAVALGVTAYLVFHGSHQKTNQPATPAVPAITQPAVSSNTPSYAVLSPATVPSKTPECSQKLTYSGNGDSEPVQCANSDLNVTEWNALAALEPTVMTLGYDASSAQVQSALCTDARDSSSDANTNFSNIIEQTTYQIAALYYGWNFSSDPSVVLTNGTC
ncbi:MAG TPA: hypothetical protein VMR08_01390 [Patescibacteria group bacterium]|jgi:hypothetical protein|nr:hypothetical protein [Patescibacteria group bacterium]